MSTSENLTSPATSIHAPIFIFMTVFIDSMGIGIIMPVMPDLIEQLTDFPTSQAAVWGGYLSLTYALMQFLFSPTIGNLSDRYGRRPVLLLSLAMLGVNYLFMGLASSIALIFIGRLLSGITAATFATANAYMADVTPASKRAQNFGLIGAAFGMGFVVGPLIGGFVGEFGVRAPFYTAAALSLINCLYGFFVIPESLPREKRRSFNLKRANPLGSLMQISRLPMLTWFFLCMFFFNLAHFIYPSIWNFYAKEMFNWSNAEIGISLAVVGVTFAIVQGGLIRYILPKLGEIKTAVLGFSSSVISLIGIAFATEGWMIYAIIPITGFGALVTPAMNAIMANLVKDDAQGELQGALASIAGITLIISPIIMTQMFGYFADKAAPIYFPGAPFLLAAILMLLAMGPFYIGQITNKRIRPV